MSTTQIPPGVPATPSGSGPRRDGNDLYDSRNWESAYRELHDAPALLLQLQDDVSRSRKREAFWISVAVHLTLILLIVNATRFVHFFPRGAVVMNPELRDKETTFLELPPDAQKVPKPPDTDKISDQNRIATRKAPQINREELKKILDAARAGRPGQSAPPVQQQPAPQSRAALPLPLSHKTCRRRQTSPILTRPQNCRRRLRRNQVSIPGPCQQDLPLKKLLAPRSPIAATMVATMAITGQASPAANRRPVWGPWTF